MIVYKTPYRLPLAGGGTDIDFYYKKKGGLLISATFNQYIYTFSSERPLDNKILVQTTESEFANSTKKVKHSTIKKVLEYFKINNKIQIGTFSTLPTKSGLGTSSSQMVGLINNLSKHKNISLSKKEIINLAYHIERKLLKDDGGWQDQIAACYGGIIKIRINKKGDFTVQKIKIDQKIRNKIERNLVLIYTDEIRYSSKIISSQRDNIKKNDIIKIYDQLKAKVIPFEKAFKKGNLKKMGEIFNSHWIIKKKLSNTISNSYLDKMYMNLMKTNKFYGGKIIGAGGGGFFLMISKNFKESNKYLKSKKMKFTQLKFEDDGSKKVD
jgi:D-glycero-alpha-D-manno-heptose-7-phosphate kinase